MDDLEISKVFDFHDLAMIKVNDVEKEISNSVQALIKNIYSHDLNVRCTSFESLTKKEIELVLQDSEKIYSLYQDQDYEVVGVINENSIAQFLQLLLGVDNKKVKESLRKPSDLELFMIDDLFSEFSNLSVWDIEDHMFKIDLISPVSLSCAFHIFRLPKIKEQLL